MATLVVPGYRAAGGTEIAPGAVALRSWLDDDWTLLISHPDDFVRCELESDRWHAILRDALRADGVRPLALAKSTGRLDAGWVTQATGDERAVLIDEPAKRSRDWLDLGARRLLEAIVALRERFVMIVDPMLHIHRTYAYGAPERLPSPLELIRWVSVLRGSTETAHEASPRSAVRRGGPSVMLRRPLETAVCA
ncbi:MAG TPA: hypothetical protein VMD03_05005 [Steroidobacteraceae bacterium]|nr:hypothetical protein [Steroidobacteraceae bacterium]